MSTKDLVQEKVDEYRGRIIEISDWIYENPELGSEEFKAAELLAGELENHGFEVERNLCDMPTAFSASYKGKAGGPRIAVLAEYDALPGIGHGCGHNLIAASAVGAGVAVSRLIEDLSGEVLVVGCPAEEGRGPSGSSKRVMAVKGFWDDVDAAIMLHGAEHYSVGSLSLAYWGVLMEFEGKTAHAASTPHQGINALNAAVMAFMAVHALRQEARRDANVVIHGIITEGGLAPNVIPDRAVVNFGVRSSDEEYLEELVDKVENCAKGAALAMGAKVKVTVPSRERPRGLASKKLNPALIELMWENYRALGAEPLKDWRETIRDMPRGTTDFAAVTQTIPAASSRIKSVPDGVAGHSRELAEATLTDEAHDALIIGTKALAMTVIDLLADPENMERVKSDFMG
jgi:amidohydrolase